MFRESIPCRNLLLTAFIHVQLSTLGLVWPSLLLTYLGQAAYLINRPEMYYKAYYASVPRAVFWPMFVLAVLSAIIASQVHRLALMTQLQHRLLLLPISLQNCQECKAGHVYFMHYIACRACFRHFAPCCDLASRRCTWLIASVVCSVITSVQAGLRCAFFCRL